MSNAGWIFYLTDEIDRYVVHVSEPDRDIAIKLIPAHLNDKRIYNEEVMSKSLNDFFPLETGGVAFGKYQR